ncbi:hypothetical protein BGZ80_007903 [Entomortierella chlamydospora]|uniref:Uncharacterized protein n=1 Tax=Entomortierella chlamydospora TaxID=101097 RepID=A0A9P6MZ63_9FUNG|nr:hypothetical protein BGZ79_010561 [Entomortierella chlamydospora]KAG0017805.1 hypothetical protein BGZ80_007903 [Entomortierella chlamydospora]
MRTAVFAFFMAMFAMLCSSVVASKAVETCTAPKTSKSTAAFDATVDFLVKEQSSIVVKAFADVCTDADISEAVSSHLNVKITGLINVDFGLGSKLSAALHSSIKANVKAEVDAQIKAEFTKNLKANIAAIIVKKCPNKDAASIRLQSKYIVSEAAKLTVKASAKISAKIQANLAAKVKAAIDLQVKKFSVNLLLVKINVTGDVKVCSSLSTKFKAAVELCTKACADIQAKEVSKVKAICAK